MSTYSPSLRIELITTGDQAGTWGNTTNTNMGTLIESAIAGYTSVSITSADQALTALNGAADESRNMVLALTTTTTANFNVYAPPAEKTYVVYNTTAYTATIYNSTVIGNTTAAGTGVAVPAGKTMTIWSDGTNFAVQNTHMASLTLGTDLAIADGGTGASTAADARTNLGLGTMATQAANNVAITGGSITGITDLAVADGGTGASTASGARTNLGAAASGANSDITSITGLTTALSISQGGTGQITANAAFNALAPSQTSQSGKYLKTDGTNASWDQLDISTADITGTLPLANGGTGATTAADARTNLGVTATGQDTTYAYRANNLSDLANATTARTNLGLGSMATQNASSVAITGGSITGITDLAIADGGTGASDAATARTNLGLGSMATQSASSVSITGGSITGITDLAVADGGTGASTASGARTNLGLAIGSDVQAYNAGLQDISGLSRTDNNFIVGNGTNWVAESGSTARTSLGLGSIATQDSSSVAITGGSITGITDLAIADGGTGASTAADARTNLGVTATGQDTTYAYRANNLSDLANAATARTNLGLGSMATQNANTVAITGGSITGITDLAVADGGTGASTAADARTNLGVPSTTGTGASGTWSISITGNAATATNSSTVTTITTSQVLGANAGASAGAVGVYMWARYNGSTDPITFGATVPGTDLTPSDSTGNNIGTAQTGTWRCMGYARGGISGSQNLTTLWLRIS